MVRRLLPKIHQKVFTHVSLQRTTATSKREVDLVRCRGTSSIVSVFDTFIPKDLHFEIIEVSLRWRLVSNIRTPYLNLQLGSKTSGGKEGNVYSFTAVFSSKRVIGCRNCDPCSWVQRRRVGHKTGDLVAQTILHHSLSPVSRFESQFLGIGRNNRHSRTRSGCPGDLESRNNFYLIGAGEQQHM